MSGRHVATKDGRLWICNECGLRNGAAAAQCRACFSLNIANVIGHDSPLHILNHPKNIMIHIFGFVMNEAPLDDALTLTCRAFSHTTYHHPSLPQRFHARLDPAFNEFCSAVCEGKSYLQMGAAKTPATHRSVLIRDGRAAATKEGLAHFPVNTMRQFSICPSADLEQSMDFLRVTADAVRYLSFVNCRFMSQTYQPSTDHNDSDDLSTSDESFDSESEEKQMSFRTYALMNGSANRKRKKKDLSFAPVTASDLHTQQSKVSLRSIPFLEDPSEEESSVFSPLRHAKLRPYGTAPAYFAPVTTMDLETSEALHSVRPSYQKLPNLDTEAERLIDVHIADDDVDGDDDDDDDTTMGGLMQTNIPGGGPMVFASVSPVEVGRAGAAPTSQLPPPPTMPPAMIAGAAEEKTSELDNLQSNDSSNAVAITPLPHLRPYGSAPLYFAPVTINDLERTKKPFPLVPAVSSRILHQTERAAAAAAAEDSASSASDAGDGGDERRIGIPSDRPQGGPMLFHAVTSIDVKPMPPMPVHPSAVTLPTKSKGGRKKTKRNRNKKAASLSSSSAVFPPIFKNCALFSIDLRSQWNHDSISLIGKFPQLTYASATIEDRIHLPPFQQWLNHIDEQSTLSVMYLELNWKIRARNMAAFEAQLAIERQLPPIVIPASVEALAVSQFGDAQIGVDLSRCKHTLKHVVVMRKSMGLVTQLFADVNDPPRSLKYLVINDVDVARAMPWQRVQQCGLTVVYTPCFPKLDYATQVPRVRSITTDEDGIEGVETVGFYPDFIAVKESLSNHRARQLLRELNMEQRRHFLWGLFFGEKIHKDALKECAKLDNL